MGLSPFTRSFLLLLAGPLIWAVHFLAIYGFVGVLCARPAAQVEWLGIALVTWGVLAAGLVAAAVAAAVLFVPPRSAPAEDRKFVHRVSAGLALLALFAIALETVAVFMVPACSSVS